MKMILVVDDEQGVANVISDILTDADYEVALAPDGQVAFDSLDDIMPDLVVSDMMMPRLDGKDLALKMQADPAYRRIPVILVTSLCRLPNIELCKFAAVLRKPFDVDDLLAVVARNV